MRKLLLIVLLLAMPFATLAQESPLELTCDQVGIDAAEAGDSFVATCPADCDGSGSLWGTDIYTDDSVVCTAAAHAGVIELEDGGEFTIYFINNGGAEHPGSEQNDIESSDWGTWATSFVFDVIPIDWNARAYDLDGDVDDSFVVLCPEDGEVSSIWGTEIYTSDSSMCTAAAHMGLIDLEDGGSFVVTFIEGQEEYEGTEQNDIETSSWGSYSLSFSVSEESLEIDWNTRAYDLEGEEGDSFAVTCPEDGEVSSIWGTEIYTSDSSMCTAAAHMGLIDLEDGGSFVVTFLEGQEEYEGTEQNDIETSSWGSYSLSFSVSEEE
ncbi:MAG: hypothetical protein Phog2KO_48110 [Phototrophicaceae bacterium]